MVSRIYPMGLIFAAIIMLVLPGFLLGIFTSSGLNPAFALTCSNNPGDFTCQNSNPSGCQAVPASCTLSGTTISFLNQQSPWTSLLRGNLFGLFSGLNTGGTYTTYNAYQIAGFGTSNVVPALCLNQYVSNSSAAYGYKPLACTQTSVTGSNLPKPQTIDIVPGPYFQNQTAVHFFQLGVTNASSYNPLGTYLEANLCQGLTSLVASGATINILLGCQYYSTTGGHTTYWYFDIDYDNTTASFAQTPQQGATRSFNYCNGHPSLNSTQCPNLLVPVTMQPETWDVRDCALQNIFPSGQPIGFNWGAGLGLFVYDPLAINPITPQCTAMQQSITNFNTASSTSTATSIASVLLWIAGIVIFIMATGINFTVTGSLFGTGVSTGAGVNRQGTKFAQILSFAMIAWIPFFSEFSSWFTSGILPNGFDGIAGITSIVINAMLFGGVMWQATQD